MDQATSQTEAIAKVRRAMAHVEEAQRELGRAMQELSPIIGAAPEHARLGRLYDRVRAEWYRLDAKLAGGRWRIRLDGIAEAALEKHSGAGSRP